MVYIWLLFSAAFYDIGNVAPVLTCPEGVEWHSETCSNQGFVIPGFPTPETWVRDVRTPNVFFGRATHYEPGLMWATALTRGFEREYLVQFDCLASGYFINDVGRVAWLLYGGQEFRCLIVDNAAAQDLYNTVVNYRESVEIEFQFFDDVLSRDPYDQKYPVVIMAYQIERPTPSEWLSAVPLDRHLFDVYKVDHHDQRGWIQVRPDQQAWFRIDGTPLGWTRIPGCLYCLDDRTHDFIVGEFIEYEVIAGDSLDLISRKIYGYSHPRFWDAIYNANRDRMKNPYFIITGTILEIPVYNEIED